MTLHRVDWGEAFVVFAVDLESEFPIQSEKHETNMRSWLAKAIFLGMALSLSVAAAMRVVDGDFSALAAAWETVKIPFGMVIGYYFVPRKDR